METKNIFLKKTIPAVCRNHKGTIYFAFVLSIVTMKS
jgi:hypothetical protein